MSEDEKMALAEAQRETAAGRPVDWSKVGLTDGSGIPTTVQAKLDELGLDNEAALQSLGRNFDLDAGTEPEPEAEVAEEADETEEVEEAPEEAPAEEAPELPAEDEGSAEAEELAAEPTEAPEEQADADGEPTEEADETEEAPLADHLATVTSFTEAAASLSDEELTAALEDGRKGVRDAAQHELDGRNA